MSLIHSKKANFTACEANKGDYVVVHEDLIFTEKLKIIEKSILEQAMCGKFEIILKMKRNPNIIHEILARGYIIKKYDPEFTIVDWRL